MRLSSLERISSGLERHCRPGIAALFVAFLSGCVAFPVPPPDQPTFDLDALPFTTGVSTRDEVATAMLETPFRHVLHRFGDDNVWVYHSRTAGWGFFIGGVSYTGAGADYHENTRNTYLTVRFDDAGIVSNLSVDTLHWGCEVSGICRAPLTGGVEGEIMILADARTDDKAKSFTTPHLGCYLYTYAEKSFLSNIYPLEVIVDGTHIGWLTNKSAYFWHELSAGKHSITARNEYSDEFPAIVPANTDCRDGELHFVRVARKGSKLEMKTDSRDTGLEQVGMRQLALTEHSAGVTIYKPSPVNNEPPQ